MKTDSRTALHIVQEWKARMKVRDSEHMGDVVDLDGYTEICLGLTPWTIGFDVAPQELYQEPG